MEMPINSEILLKEKMMRDCSPEIHKQLRIDVARLRRIQQSRMAKKYLKDNLKKKHLEMHKNNKCKCYKDLLPKAIRDKM